MANSRAHLRIRGRVQGVFFRASAQEEGERLGLAGWVRNTDDGEVEALVEGPKEAVAAFIAWCRVGPPAARVLEVQVDEQEYVGNFERFSVAPTY